MSEKKSREDETKAGSGHRGSRRPSGRPSVSRGDDPLQPAADRDEPTAHVVLYQPEIPQNTGNIGRTCVATGAKLWIVRPAAFQIDERRVRRAGLDYWQHLRLGDAADWNQLTEALGGRRFFYFSRFATRTLWQAELRPGDVFVFGSETSGLPDGLLAPSTASALRLPTRPEVRSLNLATTVGIVLYEQQRQLLQRAAAESLRDPHRHHPPTGRVGL